MSKDEVKFQEDYKYGFKDKDTSIVNTGIGLTEEVVRQISNLKNEPEWMLEFRLKAFKAFQEMPMPSFGPDLSMLNFDSYTYFTRMANGEAKNWEDVPETVSFLDSIVSFFLFSSSRLIFPIGLNSGFTFSSASRRCAPSGWECVSAGDTSSGRSRSRHTAWPRSMRRAAPGAGRRQTAACGPCSPSPACRAEAESPD